jgi:hypothetical protein
MVVRPVTVPPLPSRGDATMLTITVTEYEDGVLLSLKELVSRLPLEYAKAFRLKDFRVHYGWPLGLSMIEFENLTTTPTGLALDVNRFKELLKSEFQIIDGEIEIELSSDGEQQLLTLECIDATCWQVSTESIWVEKMLRERGFAM